MNSKKLYVGIGSVVIIVSLLVNVIYYWTRQLDEPIVLEHYKEVRVINNDINKDVYWDFYYITNTNNGCRVLSVNFPEQEITFYVEHKNNNYGTPHYTVNKDTLMAYVFEEMYDSEGTIILENAVVTYDNGLKQELDIGKIVISNGTHNGLKGSSSCSYNSGLSSVHYKLGSDIIVHNITSRLYNETHDFTYMTINDRSLTSMDLGSKNKRDYIEENRQIYNKMDALEFPQEIQNSLEVWSYMAIEDERQYNIYEPIYTLEYTYENGNEGKEDLLNIRYIPSFTTRVINKIVKARRK